MRKDLERWLKEAKAILVNPHTGEVKIRITNDHQLVLSRKQALECHDLLSQYKHKTYNEILYTLGACHGLADVELRDVVEQINEDKVEAFIEGLGNLYKIVGVSPAYVVRVKIRGDLTRSFLCTPGTKVYVKK
ncbi:MAG TPA: hypothetical protein ENG66_06115 [Thermococcus sp.]|nr:hypothetical protein [Thermococcus sp.]